VAVLCCLPATFSRSTSGLAPARRLLGIVITLQPIITPPCRPSRFRALLLQRHWRRYALASADRLRYVIANDSEAALHQEILRLFRHSGTLLRHLRQTFCPCTLRILDNHSYKVHTDVQAAARAVRSTEVHQAIHQTEPALRRTPSAWRSCDLNSALSGLCLVYAEHSIMLLISADTTMRLRCTVQISNSPLPPDPIRRADIGRDFAAFAPDPFLTKIVTFL
jgi:hypothetical protein